MHTTHPRHALVASPRELDAKLELLQQLGYASRYSYGEDTDNILLSEKDPYGLDTDRWIQSEYKWSPDQASEPAAGIPDLFDGASFFISLPSLNFRSRAHFPSCTAYTSQSRKMKRRVCHMYTIPHSSPAGSRCLRLPERVPRVSSSRRGPTWTRCVPFTPGLYSPAPPSLVSVSPMMFRVFVRLPRARRRDPLSSAGCLRAAVSWENLVEDAGRPSKF